MRNGLSFPTACVRRDHAVHSVSTNGVAPRVARYIWKMDSSWMVAIITDYLRHGMTGISRESAN